MYTDTLDSIRPSPIFTFFSFLLYAHTNSSSDSVKEVFAFWNSRNLTKNTTVTRTVSQNHSEVISMLLLTSRDLYLDFFLKCVQVGIRRWCLDTQAIPQWNSPFTSTTKPSPELTHQVTVTDRIITITSTTKASPEPTYQVILMARSTPEASHPPIKDKMFATQRPVSPLILSAAAKPLSSSSSDSDHRNLRDYLQEASNWVWLPFPTTPFIFFIKSFFIYLICTLTCKKANLLLRHIAHFFRNN